MIHKMWAAEGYAFEKRLDDRKMRRSRFQNLFGMGALLLVLFPFSTLSQDVVINELMADNKTIVADEDGVYSDWIEIFNAGTAPVDLTNYSLSDDAAAPRKWIFPVTTLAPGAYLTIWASGNDRKTSPDSLHTNFKLSNLGEHIGLYDETGLLVDGFHFGNQLADISYGRFPDADSALELFTTPTFSSANIHSPPPQQNTLVVNEILASNKTDRADGDGDYSDWVEIYNAGNASVDIAGYTLTDNSDLPQMWTFPAATLSPGEFLLVFASGKNRGSAGSELHTNFKLGSAGEFIGLYDAAGALVSSFNFGVQNSDVSFGRLPDGDSQLVFFTDPTPEATNVSSPTSNVQVGFSRPEGVYQNEIELSLGASIAGAEIRYEIGGASPDKRSPLYSGPLDLSENTIVRAQLFKNDQPESPVATRTYIIGEQPQLPVLSVISHPDSLFDEDDGIYFNPHERGRSWERTSHLTLIEDGQTKFSIPMGLRMHGNYSRNWDKKAMRVYFRSEYGANKLNYRVFPDKPLKSFNRLLLSAGGGDQPTGAFQWTLIRDVLTTALYRETGRHASMFKAVSLFLNGKYWGIYWIRERIDEDYFNDNLGLESVDHIEAQHTTKEAYVKAGSDTFWNETWNFFSNNDLKNRDIYQTATTRYYNIADYIDYHIFNIFISNIDWPQNNLVRFRDRTTKGPFEHVMWDTESGWMSRPRYDFDHNSLLWAIRDRVTTGLKLSGAADNEHLLWSTFITRQFLKNRDFKKRFINRFADLMNATLSPENIKKHIHQLADLLRAEIPRETARWGEDSPVEWEGGIQRLLDFSDARQRFQREAIIDELDLGGTTAKLHVEPAIGEGSVSINSLTLGAEPWTGHYFTNNKITLKAEAATGLAFFGWSNPEMPQEPVVELELTDDMQIQAIFYDTTQPLAIQDERIINVFDRSITIGWRTSQPATSQIEYGLDAQYGQKTEKDETKRFVHEKTITGLMPRTRYYLRIVSENGSAAFGEDRIIKTTKEPAYVQRVNAGGGDYTDSDNRKWSADQEYSGNAWGYVGSNSRVSVKTDPISGTSADSLFQSSRHRIEGYRFDVPEQDTYQVQLRFAEKNYEEVGRRIFSVELENKTVLENLDVYEVAGHDAALSYNFEVEVTDGTLDIDFIQALGSQIIAAIEVKSSTPPADLTAPAISEIQVTDFSETHVTVNWITNEAADTRVAYGLDTNYGYFTTLDTALVTAHRQKIIGLHDNTTYHARVLSRDDAGNLVTGDDFVFKTKGPDGEPPVIADVQVSDIFATGAIISWKTNGVIDTHVQYGLNVNYNMTAFPGQKKTATSGSSGSEPLFSYNVTLGNLQPDTEYHLRIHAGDSTGNTTNSQDFSFRTRPEAAVPQTFSLSQNYPNPFNIETRFRLDLPEAGHVTAEIYAVNGQRIAVLVNAKLQAGHVGLDWNGRNSSGQETGSAIYILKVVYTAESGKIYQQSRRLTLLK